MNRKLTISPKVILLLGMVLSIFPISRTRVIGYFGMVILLVVLISKARKIRIDPIVSVALGMLVYLLVRYSIQMMCGNWYPASTRSLILQSVTYFIIILARNARFELDDWKWIYFRFALFVLLLGIYLFSTKQLVYSSLFSTMFGNFLLITFGLGMILFNLYQEKRMKVVIIILLILVFVLTFLSEMRSAAVGELVGLAYMIFASLKNEGKWMNRIAFFLVVSTCFLVPYVYMELFEPSFSFTQELSIWLQKKVLYYTGARLFSGRNNLWFYVIPALDENIIFGRGIGFTPSLLMDTTLSTHNLFLFIRMEQGLLGLFLFALLLFRVWNAFYLQKRNKTKFAAQGFMLTVLLQQTFSLGLIGGKGAFSIIVWLILISLTQEEEMNGNITAGNKSLS